MAGMQELEALAAEFAAGPILIHSDVMKAASFVGEYRGKEAFLESHWKILKRIAGDRPLWFPCFNYDFVKSAPCLNSFDASTPIGATRYRSTRSPVPGLHQLQ